MLHFVRNRYDLAKYIAQSKGKRGFVILDGDCRLLAPSILSVPAYKRPGFNESAKRIYASRTELVFLEPQS